MDMPCDFCDKAYTCTLEDLETCEPYHDWYENKMAREQMVANYLRREQTALLCEQVEDECSQRNDDGKLSNIGFAATKKIKHRDGSYSWEITLTEDGASLAEAMYKGGMQKVVDWVEAHHKFGCDEMEAWHDFKEKNL